MMNRKTQAVFLSLLLLLCLLLTACGNDGAPSESSSPETTGEPLPEKEPISIPTSELKDYQIVIPDNAGTYIQSAAIMLRDAIRGKSGVLLTTSSDVYRFISKSKVVKDKEILVGMTNREETGTLLKNLRSGDSGFAAIGKKIAVTGTNDKLTEEAVSALIEALFPSDGVFYDNASDSVTRSPDANRDPAPLLCGVPLDEYRIVYTGTTEQMLWTRDTVQEKIAEATGIILPCVTSDILDPDNPAPSLLLGCFEKVDKSLFTQTIGFGESYYEAVTLGSQPQIVLEGDSYLTALLAADGLLDDLKAGTTAAVGEVRTVRDEAYYTQKEEKVEGYPVKAITIGGVPVGEFAIVYGAEDSEISKNAAQEMAKYIEMACGAVLPVIPDTESAEHEIVVGITSRDTEAVKAKRAELKNDGTLYLMDGGRLYLTSHTEKGQQYTVYHFLQDKIGVRFFTPELIAVLPCEQIDLPDTLSECYNPPLQMRLTDYRGTDSLAAQWGQTRSPRDWGGHSMSGLAEISSGTQACLQSDEVFETVLNNLRKRIEEHPEMSIFMVGQNDNFNYCKCEKCTAFAEKEGQSGLMIDFVNRLSDELTPDYPWISLLTFAYQYTREPPKNIHTRDNVIVWLCSIECCFRHPMYSVTDEENVSFCQDMENWKSYADKVFVWDYSVNYSHYSQIFPNLYVLRDNAQFMTESGMKGIFFEGDAQNSNSGEFYDLRRYLCARLTWDPLMTKETYQQIMDEFLRAYYGAGWRYIRLYIDLINECGTKGHMGCLDGNYADLLVSRELLEWCFDKAIEAAEDETTRKHCLYSTIQLMPDEDYSHEQWELMKEIGINRVSIADSGALTEPEV